MSNVLDFKITSQDITYNCASFICGLQPLPSKHVKKNTKYGG